MSCEKLPRMSLRCVRCRGPELKLESFGVYRCSVCGLVDADGRLVGEGAPAGGPVFAPPPPTLQHTSAIDLVRREKQGGSGAPPLFLAMVAMDALLIVLVGAATGNYVRMFVSVGFLVPLVTGKPWARMLALGGCALEIVFVAFFYTVLRSQLPTAAVAVLGVDAVLQLVWIYILFRGDTVRYFAQSR